MAIELEVKLNKELAKRDFEDSLEGYLRGFAIQSPFQVHKLQRGSTTDLGPMETLEPGESWIIIPREEDWKLVLTAYPVFNEVGDPQNVHVCIAGGYARTPKEFFVLACVAAWLARFNVTSILDDSGVWLKNYSMQLEEFELKLREHGVKIMHHIPL